MLRFVLDVLLLRSLTGADLRDICYLALFLLGSALYRRVIYTVVVFGAVRKGATIPMSSAHSPIDAPLTPEQVLLADQIGNEVYASHYAERKAYRLILGCGTVLLLGSMGLNLRSRPPSRHHSLYSDRRDGPCAGDSVQRSELQSA